MKKLILFSILLLIPHQAFAGLSTEDSVKFKQIATPATPSTNYNKLYFKSDDKLYKLDDAGNEVEVGASGGSGDSVTINGTAIDTTAAFTDNIYVDFTVTDGGAGGPDTVNAVFNYNATSGDVALAANEVAWGLNGLVSEGATANTIEGRFVFPDWATSDKDITFQDATHTVVGRDTTDTLTNKTLAAADNVIGADTAVALAANGANCGAGEYPLGVDSSGAVESCTDATTEIAAYAQPLDADLTTYAGITPSANIQSLLGSADYSAARTNLGLAIGTNVQAYDGDLDDLADGSLTGTKVGFADTDSNFAATNIQAAVEELDNVNVSGVNAADGKVDWTQLVSVPAGFADGTDDGGGGAGDVEAVGDCASGACFDGTQGTTLTFNNAGGDMTAAYDGTDLKFSKPLQLANDEYITNTTDDTISMVGVGGGSIDNTLSFKLSDGTFDNVEIGTSRTTLEFTDNILVQNGLTFGAYDNGNDRTGTFGMQDDADLRLSTSAGGIELFSNAGTTDIGSAAENITLTPGTNTMVVSSGTGVTLLDMGSLDVDVPTEVYDATGWNGDNTVPTKDAVRDKLEAGLTKTLAINLEPQSAKLSGGFVVQTPTSGDASTQGAQIDGSEGMWKLLFDPTTDEAAVWHTVLPPNWTAHGALKLHFSAASATTLEVEWEACVMCVTPGDSADVATASFAAVATDGGNTVPGTAGYPDVSSITLTDDSCAAGDDMWIYVSTDANDATLDDATGDRELLGAEYQYTG